MRWAKHMHFQGPNLIRQPDWRSLLAEELDLLGKSWWSRYKLYIFKVYWCSISLFSLSLPTPSFSLFPLPTCLLAFHNLLPLQALRNLELVNVLTSTVSSEVWLFRAIKIIILVYRRKIQEVIFVYSSLHPFKFLFFGKCIKFRST